MIILITGKSGSGKTYIANKISSYLNAKVISFDEISHNILTNSQILKQIKKHFGDDVFDNNALNRKKLGKIVFADSKKLEILNNLVQSSMEDEIDKILSLNEYKNYILEYALLPKMKYFNKKNVKILIKSNKHLRKSRILLRDKISEDYFEARENNSLIYNENDFDLVINNDDEINFENLSNQIKEFLC